LETRYRKWIGFPGDKNRHTKPFIIKKFFMNSTNNVSARMSFDKAREILALAMLDKFNGDFGRAREWANGRKLAQGEVRCEVQLTATSTQFVFGVTTVDANSSNTVFNTEQRLNQQDSLIVSDYGIFVRKPASATSTIDALCTYANPNTFSTGNVATALNGTFYSNGQFSLKVNNDVIIPNRGLFNHMYVPQTQGAVGITAQTIFPLDQLRGCEDGFLVTEPNIVLVGSKKYVPTIQLPANLAAVETFQRAVLIFRGILAQNSTVIN
jgi:hypothetical protein